MDMNFDTENGPENPFCYRDFMAWGGDFQTWGSTFRMQRPRLPAKQSGRKMILLNPASFQPFRFLDLPPELRLYIYKIHLIHRRGFVRLFDRFCPRLRSPTPTNLGGNLLLCCRQINEEATKVLYGGNTFLILPVSKERVYWGRRDFLDGTNPLTAPADRLLRHIGTENRSLIRKVEIQLSNPVEHSITEFYSMVSLLPNLQSIVYFFDWWTCFTASYNEFFANALPTFKLEPWYQRFFAKMPKAARVTFDITFPKHDLEDGEKCSCAKGLLREALDLQYPFGIALGESYYRQKESLDQAMYYNAQEEKEQRLMALGREVDFLDEPLELARIAQLSKGEWDDESVCCCCGDQDSIKALGEEIPGIFQGPDRGVNEDDRQYMDRKINEWFDDGCFDDDNDVNSPPKFQLTGQIADSGTDYEVPDLKLFDPFEFKDQYRLELYNESGRNTVAKWNWLLLDPNDDESYDSSDEDGDSSDDDQIMTDVNDVMQQREQTPADLKAADLRFHDPFVDGTQQTLKIVRRSDDAGTSWAIRPPEYFDPFEDGKQLILGIRKDMMEGHFIWSLCKKIQS